MSTRTYAFIAATCVAVAARALAASALLDFPALGVAGLAPLLVLGLARWRWQEKVRHKTSIDRGRTGEQMFSCLVGSIPRFVCRHVIQRRLLANRIA